MGARIIAVCDAYEAMTSNRPYQSAIPREDALAELRRCAGSQFDPEVVEAFCQEVADVTLHSSATTDGSAGSHVATNGASAASNGSHPATNGNGNGALAPGLAAASLAPIHPQAQEVQDP